MKGKRTKPVTAADLIANLHSDPKWVRQHEEREKKRRQLETQLQEEEKTLLEELASVGCPVKSVYDLVNAQERYPQAIPILQRHLVRPYHPRIREGIARALTVREARGETAWDVLREIRRSVRHDETEFRWALANALTVIGDRSMLDEINTLIRDERLQNLHSILKLAIKNINKRKSLQDKK